MTETWLDFCNRRPGPASKRGYYAIGPTRPLALISGEVKHSAEGTRAGMLAVLDGPDQKSWTFSLYSIALPDQHYPLEAIAWAAGSPGANIPYVQLEHEGYAGQPLTDTQLHYTTRITAAIRRLTAAGQTPPTRRLNLWEHNECVARYGGAATACPSGRIPWNDIIHHLDQEARTMLITNLHARHDDDEVYAEIGPSLVHISRHEYIAPQGWQRITRHAPNAAIWQRPTFYPEHDRSLP